MRVWLLFCFVIAVACSKAKNTVDEPALMGGWHPESTPDGRAIMFQSNGEIIYKQWDTLLSYTYNRYEIESDSTLTFIAPDLNTISIRYRIEDGNVLHLEGACISNCSERLYRIMPL